MDADGGGDHDDGQRAEAQAKIAQLQRFGNTVAQADELQLGDEREADGCLVGKVEDDGQRLAEVPPQKRAGKGKDCNEAQKDEGKDDGVVREAFGEFEDVVLQHPVTRGDEEGNKESDPILSIESQRSP